jgi:hypothetical protein
MLTYNAILQSGETEDEAIEYARGMVWSECDLTENNVTYSQYIDTVYDVEVYYNYAADYYFFIPTC